MRVEEVAQELGISKSHAYKVIHKLNAELREKGYLTISGRVNRNFFMEKFCYGKTEKEGYPYQAAALLRQAENVQHHCPADHHLAE